jgi:hypothetical protein
VDVHEISCTKDALNSDTLPPRIDQSIMLLALCQSGAPLDVIERRSITDNQFGYSFVGPNQKPWRCLSAQTARLILRELSADAESAMHRQLFDLWEPDGWGYLRRAEHAVAGGESTRMLNQHTSLVHGLAEIGRDFLYRQFVCLAKQLAKTRGDRACRLYAHVGAARLATRVRFGGGVRASLKHYRQAFRLSSSPGVKADLIYAIAKVLAHERQPSQLGEARRWCNLATELLPEISAQDDRAYVEIRLANVNSLISYHQGERADALGLQEHARAIADGSSHPVRHWAIPIINANTAKLLEKRFLCLDGAVELLQRNLSASDPLMQEHARIELARIHFDKGSHKKVVDLLEPIYGAELPAGFDEEQELFGRLLFSFALCIVGSALPARRQLRRISYLLRSVRTGGAQQLLAAIQQAILDADERNALDRLTG